MATLCKSLTRPSRTHVTHRCTPESHHHYNLPTSICPPAHLSIYLHIRTSPFLPILLPINPPYYLPTHLQRHLPPNPPTFLPACSSHPEVIMRCFSSGRPCWVWQRSLQHILKAILQTDGGTKQSYTSSATYLNQVCWSAQCEASAGDTSH